ncbi:hypothetical protein DF3PB_4190003 [uncultured Defluviicoccus sp.]|uniref:Uncharacterized protein n=1 Tax=metagenome TaxID=256318 RepID=A0A380TGR3_9ZZZZ|nr:hypothetical protein DF3PB_4190003 [uncultured Defluviicoccus sp.]
MRDFAHLQNAANLIKFSDSVLGTLYLHLDDRGLPKAIIRHFDRDISTSLVQAFANFIQAASSWIAHRPELAHLIHVELPSDVGRDFVALPYHIYHASTDAYIDWEDPPDMPPELEQMRGAFRAAIGRSTDPRDRIIEAVLSRNLLEPTGKTYYNEVKKKFIVVEPKITLNDIECWAALPTK